MARDIGHAFRRHPRSRRRRNRALGEIVQAALCRPYPDDVGLQSDAGRRVLRFRLLGTQPLIAKGIHVTTSLEYAFIIALANPVGPLLGFLVADRMERKWQIVWAGVLVAVFMLFVRASRTATLLIILFGVLVTLANNWISFATHNYQSELYPTRIRARAIGFVYSWSRVSAAWPGF